jgi:hypothetical protein
MSSCSCKCFSRIVELKRLDTKSNRPRINYEEKTPDESLMTDDENSLITDDESQIEMSYDDSSPKENKCDCKCHQSKNDSTRFTYADILAIIFS